MAEAASTGRPGPARRTGRGNGGVWEFREIVRASALEAADDLCPLTVVAALPGWGRTTWLRQVQSRLAATTGERGTWLGSRTAARRWFDEHPDEDTGPLFLDGVVLSADDPLWASVQRLLGAGSRLLVSTIDYAPSGLAEDLRLLDERDLRFTVAELQELVAANLDDDAPDVLATVPLRQLQHPTLARRHLERLQPGPTHADWPSPEGGLQLSLLADLQRLPEDVRRQSRMLELLRRVSLLRVASPEMLPHLAGAPDPALATHFARLEAIPFGTTTVDDETGQTVFEWAEGPWRRMLATLVPAAREQQFREALAASRQAGHVTMQLYYLLQLGEFDAAEALVDQNLRLFLLVTNEVTYQALLQAGWEQLADHPNLLVLLGELHVRRTGSAPSVERYFGRALDLLAQCTGPDAFSNLRLTARRLFAAVSLGRRDHARGALDSVVELLWGSDSGGVLGLAETDDHTRNGLAAELYLPFWAATQLDDHALALRFASVMRSHANPASPTAVAERLTALTEEVFCGTNGNATGETGHTDPVLLLESGRDAAALELVGMLASRRRSAPSRSALEALTLLVRSLAAPRLVRRSEIRDTLARGRRFWRDGVPSSLQSAAAALALVSLQDVAAARRVLAGYGQPDWFVDAAAAVVELAAQEPSSAMRRLEAATPRCAAPRAVAVTGVLIAAAHVQLGREEAAAAQLGALAHQVPAELLRFALRFVSPAVFDALRSLTDPRALAAHPVLTAAAADPRYLGSGTPLQLTRVERELLALLREGCTNTEISRRRVVSINTVRTELRHLFRKLAVEGRLAAVARAEELRLFESVS